jgi:hypothetical protein
VVRPTVTVRPTAPAHVPGPAVDISPADLVPVRTVTRPSPRARVARRSGPAGLIAAALAALTLLVAILGLGDPHLRRDLPDDALAVSQADAGSTIDLSAPVLVSGPAVADATRVDLEFLVAGVGMLSVSQPVQGGQASIDPGTADLVVPSPAIMRFTLHGAAGTRTQDVRVDTEQGPLTVVGAVGLVAVLYGLASIESSRRRLRRRPLRIGSLVHMVWNGGLTGVGLVLLSWAVLARPATMAALAVALVAGAASGLAFGLSFQPSRRPPRRS